MSTPDRIVYTTTNRSIYEFTSSVLDPADRGKFDLTAPYQRESVWDLPRKRALIRSLVTGVPIGSVTVSTLPNRVAAETGFWERVVDGKQRIETIRSFVTDGFSVEKDLFYPGELVDGGDGLPSWVFWSDLTTATQRGFRHSTLGVVEFRGETEFTYDPATLKIVNRRDRTPDELLQAEAEFYLLVNFGGVPHADEDYKRAAQVARPGS